MTEHNLEGIIRKIGRCQINVGSTVVMAIIEPDQVYGLIAFAMTYMLVCQHFNTQTEEKFANSVFVMVAKDTKNLRLVRQVLCQFFVRPIPGGSP